MSYIHPGYTYHLLGQGSDEGMRYNYDARRLAIY